MENGRREKSSIASRLADLPNLDRGRTRHSWLSLGSGIRLVISQSPPASKLKRNIETHEVVVLLSCSSLILRVRPSQPIIFHLIPSHASQVSQDGLTHGCRCTGGYAHRWVRLLTGVSEQDLGYTRRTQVIGTACCKRGYTVRRVSQPETGLRLANFVRSSQSTPIYRPSHRGPVEY